MKKILLIALILFFSKADFAGTIIFKDGTKLSGVEIVSISDGEIIIEKDKAKRTYSIKLVKSYYGTDLANTSEEIPGEFSDYTVKILDIQVPKKGVDAKNKTSKCEIEYTISRKGPSQKVKVPYFYFFVITPGKNEVSGRQIYSFSYPKQAKPKGKDYDEAAIMAEIADFGRPVWHAQDNNLKGKLNGRSISFDLKGVGKRDILAWHLEVWGNDNKLLEKTEDLMQLDGRKVGKNWWKREINN